MKKVIRDQELRIKIQEAIDLLCDTVKSTLGPKGSNAIIDHSAFSPFITNDGVTIASQIESEDEVVNTILELAKEAAIKTNEEVGDGTTTTLVLLQSLMQQGLKLVNEGMNPIILKKELTAALKETLALLKNRAWLPNNEKLKFIASSSANSLTIGENVIKAFKKVKTLDAITIKENKKDYDEVILNKGYTIETLIASPYFWQNNKEIKKDNVNVLLINDIITDFNFLSDILNQVITNKESLIILANDYTEDVINTWISFYLTEKIDLILLKTPGYGKEKYVYLQDLALISGAKIENDSTNIGSENIGKINKLILREEKVTFGFKTNSDLKRKITKIKQENDEFTAHRLAMLNSGLIEILVGAPTVTERREKKMRYEDALNAVNVAKKGITLGSGVTLLAISELLTKKTNGYKLMRDALVSPLKQIIANAGLDEEAIINSIRESNYTKIYNIKTDNWEAQNQSKVLDPVVVISQTLTNATSIASMLLTTTSLIINENKPNILPHSETEF